MKTICEGNGKEEDFLNERLRALTTGRQFLVIRKDLLREGGRLFAYKMCGTNDANEVVRPEVIKSAFEIIDTRSGEDLLPKLKEQYAGAGPFPDPVSADDILGCCLVPSD